jgi:hypothetical protein
VIFGTCFYAHLVGAEGFESIEMPFVTTIALASAFE